MEAPILFPNYLQVPQPVPMAVWRWARLAVLAIVAAVVACLLLWPQWALPAFWKLLVPLLPAVFLAAPGLWRNVCPMATLNQTPRLFGFTKGLAHTPMVREYSYAVGMALFFGLVASRRWLFDHSGTATALLIVFGLSGAFIGGLVFKGKSGWCSSICPMLPVQRLYGQTPFQLIPNAHCQPCVGCTKNCYDFNPRVAYLADQYDEDRRYGAYRRLFAGLLPGFILAFFQSPPNASALDLYAHMALYAALSLALFQLLDVFLKVPPNRLTIVFGAAAISSYYWFALPGASATLALLAGLEIPQWPAQLLRALLLLTACLWVLRGFQQENRFRAQAAQKTTQQGTRLGEGANEALRKVAQAAQVEMVIEPEQLRVPGPAGHTLLELIEGCGAKIESGCRMGVCGADPIAVTAGMECLSEIGDDERSTLGRLGCAPNTRMACSARLQRGSVRIELQPQRALPGAQTGAGGSADTSIKDVVIIGNGIAGVTAADHVRRHHPDCSIRIVAQENHALYNRMGITRLVYGRSAMQGLYLLPEAWYSERKIDVLLNTAASKVLPEQQKVVLAEGDELHYDRLILACGSSSHVPPIPGYGGEACFVLRTANDAMDLRAFAQRHQAQHAVIAGGGLLGLEAAYALHKMGLHVAVVERNAWLLHRQLDERAGQLLQRYLESLGLEIVLGAALQGVARDADGRQQVLLQGAGALPADLFIVAAGITPNTRLASEAGLRVQRGVCVDDAMRTSDPLIYAAGDLAEYQGRLFGLWPVAVEQAEVAACSALGQLRPYKEPVPSTILKVVGVELISLGRFDPQSGDEVLVEEDSAAHRYRKLVLHDGILVGAILIGWPDLSERVSKAVKSGADLSAALPALRQGDWSTLAQTAA